MADPFTTKKYDSPFTPCYNSRNHNPAQVRRMDAKPDSPLMCLNCHCFVKRTKDGRITKE